MIYDEKTLSSSHAQYFLFFHSFYEWMNEKKIVCLNMIMKFDILMTHILCHFIFFLCFQRISHFLVNFANKPEERDGKL